MGALLPGQRLDGTSYQVVREIGAGGMGVVYEIEHVRLKKRYVAKVIHDTIRDDEGARRRMDREAQVLASLSHPNVVQVHDVGTTGDGVHYFVMEKLEGVDLRAAMKTPLPRARAIEIVADVLDALDYVHRRGIVHRDIKPENIFLADQPHGTVTKVLDFGIVHIFDSDGQLSQGRITKTGSFAGTLHYASPEQMQGKSPGPPNDVYAAGLVLFELLAGKGPFDDDPGVGLSRCFKPAPRLGDIVSAPEELSDAIARALAQEPTARPSAAALAADLRKVAALRQRADAATHEDPIRVEVDDLLRGIVRSGARPVRDVGLVLPPFSVDGDTAVPATPLMARSPQRPQEHLASADARGPAAFEPTLASAGSDRPPPLPLGVGATGPQRAAPPSPHSPAHAPGPTGAAIPSSPAPRSAGPHAQPPPATHVPSALTPSGPSPRTSSARAQVGQTTTAPGVYATTDGSTRAGRRNLSPALLAAMGVTAMLGIVVLGGAVAYRQKTTATAQAASAEPSKAASNPTARADATIGAVSGLASSASSSLPPAPAPLASAAATTASTASSSSLALPLASAAATTASSATPLGHGKPTPGTSGRARADATPSSQPPPKPGAPVGPTLSKDQGKPGGAEKDGYLREL